MGEIFYLE